MRKISIQALKELAIDKNGLCLSDILSHSKEKITFKCKNGHIFNSSAGNVFYNGSWCPLCPIVSDKKLSNQKIDEIVSSKNLKFIEGQYKDYKSIITVRCICGELFKTSILKIKKAKQPCNACRVKIEQPYKYNISHFIKAAKERGGVCLSEEFRGINTKLKFQCAEGHIWDASPQDIIYKNSWCPDCSGLKRKTIVDLLNILPPGWECLNSDCFYDSKTRLNFKCDKGHEFKSNYNRIYIGTNCPYCANKAKLSIADLNNFVEKRGGKLLSLNYNNNKEKLLWECKVGHKFLMSAHAVKTNSWCPLCSNFYHENICKKVFESYYGYTFIKVRPKWLMGYNEYPLELDGYCAQLNIAFEYNGVQHYKFTPCFHSSKEDFVKQQERDKLKLEICKKLGIKLIVIPYIKKTSEENLMKIIEEEIEKSKV